jgi:hypothetical protein
MSFLTNNRKAASDRVSCKTVVAGTNRMVFLNPAISFNAARAWTRVLALESNASFVVGTLIINRTFWSASLDTSWIAVISILAKAQWLTTWRHFADRIWTARTREAWANGRPQALGIWISLKARFAEALLLISSNVAISIRSTRTRFA